MLLKTWCSDIQIGWLTWCHMYYLWTESLAALSVVGTSSTHNVTWRTAAVFIVNEFRTAAQKLTLCQTTPGVPVVYISYSIDSTQCVFKHLYSEGQHLYSFTCLSNHNANKEAKDCIPLLFIKTKNKTRNTPAHFACQLRLD